MKYILPTFLLIVSSTISCTSIKQIVVQTPLNANSLVYLDTYTIPNNFQFMQTTVGGLSSIDYDVKNNQYYLISDDRSANNPARFYTATIAIKNNKIDTVAFISRAFLQDNKGKPYPSTKQDPTQTPDPESMRFHPRTKQLVWSSEGERSIRPKESILINPAVYFIDTIGKWKDSLQMPANLYMSLSEKGPRQNGVLEGMSYADQYRTLMLNVEEPLHEDGPRADLQPNKAMIRFFAFDHKTKKCIKQYAYELDPVAHKPNPTNGFIVNGVPEFLWIGNNQLLVLERSFSTGRIPCTIKIYLADYGAASDVTNLATLKDTTQYQPMKKTLLMNMDQLGIFTDNIEGISMGPLLPNGNRSVLLVADNNFSPLQRSQIILLGLKTK
jgi:hypothetical protein